MYFDEVNGGHCLCFEFEFDCVTTYKPKGDSLLEKLEYKFLGEEDAGDTIICFRDFEKSIYVVDDLSKVSISIYPVKKGQSNWTCLRIRENR